MRTIISIEHIEEKKTEAGKTYWRTHALLDDGTEAIGYGKDFDIEEKVECFFDEKWGIVKMKKKS